ncbi:probable methyltransferase PMT23 [Physcomitrium patens]|uniref:Methyltransferase n=1 Tax=Physcomitrium patens TaxID=3218 RepID=A0A2K1IHV5_PHYPA|nr:probable methyltransferase PMT23 [Physcomitrium patens]PNR28859.1 hypothetical protein PHYPA_027551 [Physcomitrium patens]|eukprot:XP_024362472.1 probable methyltransferase PMT23 [Physcomitrella patens]
MVFPKHGRQERRGPAPHVIILGSLFVAFVFIGVWVYTSPAPIEDVQYKTATQPSETIKDFEKTTDASVDAQLDDDSKDDETDKVEADQSIDENDKGEETSDESERRPEEESPEVDESTILDKSLQEERKAEEEAKKAEEEAKIAVKIGPADDEAKEDAVEDGESRTVKEEVQRDDDIGDSLVAKKHEAIEDATDESSADGTKGESQDADELPSVDTSESHTTSDPDSQDATSSWKSQDEESTEEKEATKKFTDVVKTDLEAVPETSSSEETEPATLTEEEKKIEEKQEMATTPIVIQEAVAKVEAPKYKWKLCEWRGAQDYIPCLDNKKWLTTHKQRKHYEHRERHCPTPKQLPKCLVPLPAGYKPHIKWPDSRSETWYNNVPHAGLAQYKKDQNWVKKQGEKLIFPGGGTQFKHGAGHYIDWVQKIYPTIRWGKHTRVLLDVGCGVASFGGYLYDRDVLAMSFAPRDEHEAQVQLALERGIPAFSSVMGTQRLVFSSNSFDVVHCARCRVPWHVDGGKLLLELNRVLRPGGHFVWSATPVYQDLEEDKQIWKDTTAVIEAMRWKMVAKETDEETQIGVAIFQKPATNEVYESSTGGGPEMCQDDNPNAAWYVKMTPCIYKIPDTKRSEWPEEWPLRATAVPKWLNSKDTGLYGKPAPEDFDTDTKHWERVVAKTYLPELGIDWSTIRNVMDMKAGYGGFAAALRAEKVWVLNIVPVTEPDTLPIIYDRGFIGMYHNWCEPHSTYPRTYDLLHVDHLITSVKAKECSIVHLMMEMDRILRPDGWAIFRDEKSNLVEVEEILKSLHWDVKLSFSKQNEELLAVQKKFWRPDPKESS